MENPQAPDLPGFTLGRLLGSGGSASVWLAREHQTGRNFAVKCFRTVPGGPHSAEAITEDAIRREIRILSLLDHPHLVKAHDVVRLAVPEDGTALVMDYAPGGSLAALLEVRGRLSVGETVTVLTPVAQVLGYLHGHGFTHSDVAPGNVLFTGQGKPLLSDLGIARILGDPGDAATSGTPGFMDPAPADPVRGLQPERDVYSAAALGWFCLTGQAPPRTAYRPPLSLLVPEVPRELAAALEAGLDENRRRRPTAAALATAVYRSASPQPLDLAASVHPTVVPELVTRRHVPDASRPGAVREKVKAAGRWISTATWVRLPISVQRMPFPPTRNDRAASGGKHAGRAPRSGPRTALLLRGLPAAAGVLGLAAAWWIVGPGPLPAESPPAAVAIQGQETVSGQGADIAREDGAVQEGSTLGKDGDTGGGRTVAPEAAPLPAGIGTLDVLAAAGRQQARAEDPAQAVRGLAVLRDLAFSSGHLELLGEVNVDGSPAAIADQQTAERLRGPGHVLAGFSSTLADVRTEEGATSAQAVVRVRSSSSAYEEKDSGGSVVGTGSASKDRGLRLVLVAVNGTWRISEIRPGD
ncbi:serine/threonine protein kinase [Arthrobacter sp. AFG7.2]|uniref:serine/threonine-protein kinase n=1 Tax=Arthrobacter sp. AFG7.2 TaxID=1688693 RepID=UPI000C9E759E|nr:serine/threonine-protein kinase [Arthrobacter sp. AFG7.2]PNI08007.1 serine/threonine protein kinase [Arthrobacter sp. AFG7.2]